MVFGWSHGLVSHALTFTNVTVFQKHLLETVYSFFRMLQSPVHGFEFFAGVTVFTLSLLFIFVVRRHWPSFNDENSQRYDAEKAEQYRADEAERSFQNRKKVRQQLATLEDRGEPHMAPATPSKHSPDHSKFGRKDRSAYLPIRKDTNPPI